MNVLNQIKCLVIAVFFMLLNYSQLTFAVTFPDKLSSRGFLLDSASLVSLEHSDELNRIGGALLDEKRVPLFVVTISSLADYGASGYTIERYARELFDHWGYRL